jgi:hypothetical protein
MNISGFIIRSRLRDLREQGLILLGKVLFHEFEPLRQHLDLSASLGALQQQMGEVFLAEGLEGSLQNSLYAFNVQILISDFHHLQEESDDGVVSFGSGDCSLLLIVDELRNFFVDFEVEKGAQFANKLGMQIFEMTECRHSDGCDPINFNFTLFKQLFANPQDN